MQGMSRPFNFSAGPATLPESVLRQAAAEMLDWHGSGMSVMEMSHRGAHFQQIHEQALADFRKLLEVPADFEVLFLQGGGLAENALVPMNLLGGAQHGLASFVITGSWSAKSEREAQRYGRTQIAAKASADTELPDVTRWQIAPDTRYLHICGNETIDGVEFAELPDLKAAGLDLPLVVDFSSHVLSRRIDWSRVGVAFGGAQKNIGCAGLTIVVIRNDLLDRALSICPSAFHFKTVAAHGSMYNTPPTYAIYIAGLVFQWLLQQGGVDEMARRAQARSVLMYERIDRNTFYTNSVPAGSRSRMNIPFYLRDASLNDAFLAGARERGLLQLKGHKSVGGMRASVYNAMPIEGVQALVAYMDAFEAEHG
jgi:phosphoserine aminotransferase